LINELNNITFLRFNYPYETKYAHVDGSLIREYENNMHMFQGRFFSRLRLKYPRKHNNRINVINYDLFSESLARVDKVKYNKVIGTIFPQRILEVARQDLSAWDQIEVIEIFDLNIDEVINNIESLIEKKIDSIDDNIYASIYPIWSDYNKGMQPISTNSNLLINLTKKKLKQVL